MSTPITYDGVASAQGGNLFKDVNFWVSRRVPGRDGILNQIQMNGGQVVPLEKNADILIADHARPKVEPAGSYSWTFITDSVQNGVIQLQDRYRIGPHPDTPLPVGSRGVQKVGRTAFSHEDDAILAKWVLSHKEGQFFGNKIYQELEMMNPRHTWHSWRSRFDKRLKLLPLQQLKMLAATVPADSPLFLKKDPQPDDTPQPEIAPLQQEVPTPKEVTQPHEIRQQEKVPSPDHARQPTVMRQKDLSKSPVSPRLQSVQANSQAAALRVRGQPKEGKSREHERIVPLAAEELATITNGQETEDDENEEELRTQFYRDFDDYVHAQGLDINRTAQIQGRTVDLWDLSSVVDRQETTTNEVSWRLVAEELGYSGTQAQRAAKQLENMYENTLVGFFETMEDFKGLEEDDIVSALSRSPSPGLFVPSSPPVSLLGKRRRDPESRQSPGRVKRGRRNPNAEIPSTPDEKLGVQRPSASERPGPSSKKRRSFIPDTYEVVGDSQDSQQLPPLPGVVDERRLEPETQDFAFDQATQMPALLETRESSYDVTPSQQLHSEAYDATPIPIQLPKGRRDERTPAGLDSTARAADSGSGPQSRKASASKRVLPPTYAPQAPRAAIRASTSAPAQLPAEGPRKSADEQIGNRDQIDEWIEYYESLGYSEAHVKTALRSTTMTAGGEAALVMQSLRDGHGVPTHTRGVWTNRDDESMRLIESTDLDAQDPELALQRKKAKKEFTRLVKKHEEGRIRVRLDFLIADAEIRNEKWP